MLHKLYRLAGCTVCLFCRDVRETTPLLKPDDWKKNIINIIQFFSPKKGNGIRMSNQPTEYMKLFKILTLILENKCYRAELFLDRL